MRIKVICVDNNCSGYTSHVEITVGKVYDGILCLKSETGARGDYYIVHDDNDKEVAFGTDKFVPLAEHRDNQINEIFYDG